MPAVILLRVQSILVRLPKLAHFAFAHISRGMFSRQVFGDGGEVEGKGRKGQSIHFGKGKGTRRIIALLLPPPCSRIYLYTSGGKIILQ